MGNNYECLAAEPETIETCDGGDEKSLGADNHSTNPNPNPTLTLTFNPNPDPDPEPNPNPSPN